MGGRMNPLAEPMITATRPKQIQKEVTMCPRCGFRTLHILDKCQNHAENFFRERPELGLKWTPLKVVFAIPSAGIGGVPQWMSALSWGLCPERFIVTAVATVYTNAETGTEMTAWFPKHVAHLHWQHVRDADIIVSWGLTDLVRIAGEFLKKCPWVTWVDSQHASRLTPDWQLPLVQAAFRAHQLFGIPTAAVSEACRRNFPPGFPMEVIPNGVHKARVLPTVSDGFMRIRYGIPTGAKVILSVSRVSREKQPQLFADTLACLGEDYFGIMAGPQNNVPLKLPSNVRYVGSVTHVANLYGIADAFLLPSLGEGHCMAINEAWAARVPVVCTLYSHMEEMIATHGKLAITVPLPGTNTGLADAVRKAVSGGDEVREILDNAEKLADGEFSGELMCRRWSEFLWKAAGYS